VALGSLLPLISKLFYDVEILVRESTGVDEEIALAL